jgi:hypothetical protein
VYEFDSSLKDNVSSSRAFEGLILPQLRRLNKPMLDRVNVIDYD